MKKDESPDVRYGPRLTIRLNAIAARLLTESGGTSLRIDCDFLYRVLDQGRTTLELTVTPDCGPRDRPMLEKVFTQLAQAVHQESLASGIRILCKFDYNRLDASRPGKGNTHLTTRVTPDALRERLGDGALLPRGTKLAQDASRSLRKAMRTVALGRIPS